MTQEQKENLWIIEEIRKIENEIYNLIKNTYDYKSPIIPAIVENAIVNKRKELEINLKEDD